VKTHNDFSWMIGGPQGSGVESSAILFARACVSAGLWIYGKREYHSNIVGDHSYFQMRVSDHPVRSHVDPVHLLATFENSTARIHAAEVVEGGALIYDPRHTRPEELQLRPGVLRVPLDYDALLEDLARELGQDAKRLAIMKNTVAVAASFALLSLPVAPLRQALEGIFTGRKAKLVPANVAAAEKAYAAIPREVVKAFPWDLYVKEGAPRRLVINGVVATAMGKLKAGCRFNTYYPITPASDEGVFLEAHPEFGILVAQAEDEIAAVTMAVGAGIAGVRSSTSTSGPGFSLMSEGTGWAGMNEIPVVIFDYQRGGPATGLPTRHEQGDLLFAIHAAHGEFPRLVLAPGDLEEYFQDAFHAFNYAERYQTPVIVLTDKALANNTQSVLPFSEDGLRIDRGLHPSEAELARSAENGGEYPRFKITDSGVSPRPLPGQRGGIFWMTGDEHDEKGHISEDPGNRIRMHAKRMRKLVAAAREIPAERQWRLHGDPGAPLTIVSWGSPKGPILDALAVLEKQGVHANFLQVRLMWPFPAEGVKEVLGRARQVVDVEMNITGQLAALIRQQTGIDIPHRILKWNGRPISETEVVEAVTEVAEKRSREVVLSHGL
jgi:2-oxoglutarate ferredoxin oxidoreductase subunit alpha